MLLKSLEQHVIRPQWRQKLAVFADLSQISKLLPYIQIIARPVVDHADPIVQAGKYFRQMFSSDGRSTTTFAVEDFSPLGILAILVLAVTSAACECVIFHYQLYTLTDGSYGCNKYSK